LVFFAFIAWGAATVAATRSRGANVATGRGVAVAIKRGVVVDDGSVEAKGRGNAVEATVVSTTMAAATATAVIAVCNVNHGGATKRRGRNGTGRGKLLMGRRAPGCATECGRGGKTVRSSPAPAGWRRA